jgi:hypothetical protein
MEEVQVLLNYLKFILDHHYSVCIVVFASLFKSNCSFYLYRFCMWSSFFPLVLKLLSV